MGDRTIWKFPFDVVDEFVIQMPEGAQVLSVAVQGVPCMWATVATGARMQSRRFSLRGTGHPLGDVGKHIGTFQMQGGALVFHLFEAAE